MNALLNAAFDAECDEPSDKLVLVYLADRANVNGKAWPHLPTIVRHTGLGRSTIIEAIKRIEARGHLTVGRKAGCSNRYLIHPVTDARARPATRPVRLADASSPATRPLPVQPQDQHPNLHGTSKGNGKPAPRFKREGWQQLRDEKALKDRLTTERESCSPDKALIESLKLQLREVRDEMKGQHASQ